MYLRSVKSKFSLSACMVPSLLNVCVQCSLSSFSLTLKVVNVSLTSIMFDDSACATEMLKPDGATLLTTLDTVGTLKANVAATASVPTRLKVRNLPCHNNVFFFNKYQFLSG